MGIEGGRLETENEADIILKGGLWHGGGGGGGEGRTKPLLHCHPKWIKSEVDGWEQFIFATSTLYYPVPTDLSPCASASVWSLHVTPTPICKALLLPQMHLSHITYASFSAVRLIYSAFLKWPFLRSFLFVFINTEISHYSNKKISQFIRSHVKKKN